jgi:hypothetical protein
VGISNGGKVDGIIIEWSDNKVKLLQNFGKAASIIDTDQFDNQYNKLSDKRVGDGIIDDVRSGTVDSTVRTGRITIWGVDGLEIQTGY